MCLLIAIYNIILEFRVQIMTVLLLVYETSA